MRQHYETPTARRVGFPLRQSGTTTGAGAAQDQVRPDRMTPRLA